MSDTESAVVLGMLAAALFALGLMTGIKSEQGVSNALRKEAIKHGAAEYVLVDGGPKTEFRWKEASR